MSDHCHDRFKTWISQTTGGAIHGEVVVAELYDAAQAELSALREELATSRTNEYNAQVRMSEQHDRLTAAEKRNSKLLEVLKGLRLNANPALFSPGQIAQVDAALKPTDSGASE